MARREPSRITMTAREVIARGAPFRAWHKTFADAGVAHDEIVALQAKVEPLVLRVSAVGGNARGRKMVEGDWLCLADGSAPVRIPKPQWVYNGAAKVWSSELSWLEAWEQCDDARWSLHASAGAFATPRNKMLCLAMCACARTALAFVPAQETRPARALDAAERWLKQGGDGAALYAASQAAWDAIGAAVDDRSFAAAVNAAAIAAGRVAVTTNHQWVFTAREERYAANSIAMVAFYAATAASIAGSSDMGAALSRMADLVRREVPTVEILRAVTARDRASSPSDAA